MALSIVESDVYVNGSLTARSFAAPTDSVSDNAIAALAAIQASKLQHQHEPTLVLSNHGSDVAAHRKVIHRVKGATATIVEFGVGASGAAGASSSATVQLKKNGTNILTSAITLDDTTAAFTLKTPAGFTSTSLVAGDVLEVDVTAVSGANPPEGMFASLTLREDAQ